MIKYYTDFHNVDEDLTIVSDQGGHWYESSVAGITRRDMVKPPTNAATDVASSII